MRGIVGRTAGQRVHPSYAEIEITFVPPKEGGRRFAPSLREPGYRPHLRVPPSVELLGVEFVDGPDGPAPMGVPPYGIVRFLYEPAVSYAPLQVGAEIEVVEGPSVVARGRVTRRTFDPPGGTESSTVSLRRDRS